MIEMTTIVVVVAMFAALSAPALGRAITGSQRRSYRVGVLTLAGRAREEAVHAKHEVRLRSDSSSFSIETTGDDGTTTAIQSITAVSGVEASHFWTNGSETSEGEWAVSFYADGSSSGGGFQFDEGEESTSVHFAKLDGAVSTTPEAADPTIENGLDWDAGGYAQGG